MDLVWADILLLALALLQLMLRQNWVSPNHFQTTTSAQELRDCLYSHWKSSLCEKCLRNVSAREIEPLELESDQSDESKDGSSESKLTESLLDGQMPDLPSWFQTSTLSQLSADGEPVYEGLEEGWLLLLVRGLLSLPPPNNQDKGVSHCSSSFLSGFLSRLYCLPFSGPFPLFLWCSS